MSQGQVETRPGYLVKRAQQLLRQACDEELRTTGLSMSQYATLRALADHPAASSAELARLCFVTRQSLGEVLGGLRAAGLVVMAEQAHNGRARPLALTAIGRTRLRAADRTVSTVEKRMLAGIPASEQRRLGTLLAACAKNLSSSYIRKN